jgi:hypothetical protein
VTERVTNEFAKNHANCELISSNDEKGQRLRGEIRGENHCISRMRPKRSRGLAVIAATRCPFDAGFGY